MSAATPLRAEPFAALVQRPRRKAHLATIVDGAETLTTWCDRELPVAGTDVTHIDSPADAAHADNVCAHCYRMSLVAALTEQRVLRRLLPAGAVDSVLAMWGNSGLRRFIRALERTAAA